MVVIGVGNFGGWWVTGLLRSPVPLKVVFHDPNPDAERLVLDRLDSGPDRVVRPDNLIFVPRLVDLPEYADLVVVATNADVRPSVVEQVSGIIDCQTWVLEKVLAQSTSALASLGKSLEGRDVYVNHSRRFQPATSFLAAVFAGRGIPESIILSGGLWELASNASHFLDLVEFWFSTELVSIDATGLGPWRPSRTRASGFEDVDGHMIAFFREGIRFKLDWGKAERATWEFQFKKNIIAYDEISGSIHLDGEEIARVPLANFGDLVPTIIKHWVSTGDFFPLPALERASEVHHHLLESFSFSRSRTGQATETVPIS